MRTPPLVFCLVLLLASGARSQESLYVRAVGFWYSPQPHVTGVAPSGNCVYAANGWAGLRVVSVADPTHPIEVGYCDTDSIFAADVTVVGDYAYVADWTFGLRIISVADPTHPIEVGECSTPGGSNEVVVDGEYAYVAGQDSGLRVISVADPAHPIEVGYYDTPGYVRGVAVVGDYAYITDHQYGLRVVLIADPRRPVEVGHCDTPGWGAEDVEVVGDFAYVAGTDSGLRVISVADPAHPVEVGSCDLMGFAVAVSMFRSYAFVACQDYGFRAVLVADPARPVEVAYYRLGENWCSTMDEDHVYVGGFLGLTILQFCQLGDLDVDSDSLDVVADTLRLHRPDSTGLALGEFVLANTSAAYNPVSIDGPSLSPVDSLGFTGSLTGQGGTLDSILIPSLPASLAQGQTIVCTLAVYVPQGMRFGDYSGSITITGNDTAGLQVGETFYALTKNKHGDLDVDNDSLDVVADTIRVRPRLVSSRPPPEYTEYALGKFTLANTSESYNPDTSDGPSLSPLDSLRFTGSLAGPGGTIDSILIPDLPHSLSLGQIVTCTLRVYVPVGLRDGDYSGPIVISGYDSLHYEVAETVYALVTKLGDLDIDGDSLNVIRDTLDLRTQPAGPVYSPYAKAAFVLVNTASAYNPDSQDGPSLSLLRSVKVEAEMEAQGRFARGVNSEFRMVKSGSDFHSSHFTLDSSAVGIYVLNLPESLAVGQAVECTLALVVPVGTALDNYSGLVAIDAYDGLGFRVRDSFFLVVRGPRPRENLDSLRVAPIPFKPNQNPEHDAIHFQGLTAGARAVVYDASGQSVWSATETGDGHLEWDAKVASGIYVYLVVSADGKNSKVGKLSVIR